MLSWPSSHRTRYRVDTSLPMTSRISPSREGVPTCSDSTTIRSPTSALMLGPPSELSFSLSRQDRAVECPSTAPGFPPLRVGQGFGGNGCPQIARGKLLPPDEEGGLARERTTGGIPIRPARRGRRRGDARRGRPARPGGAELVADRRALARDGGP